jgi:hypothetical protein
LPVIADFCRRLDIAGIIDGLCPIRDITLATHGQVIEVLIANRLTNPKAMVGIADWAWAWPVGECTASRPRRCATTVSAVPWSLSGRLCNCPLCC